MLVLNPSRRSCRGIGAMLYCYLTETYQEPIFFLSAKFGVCSEEMDLRRGKKLPLGVLLGSFADQCSIDHQQQEQMQVSEMRKCTELKRENWPDSGSNKQHSASLVPAKRKRESFIKIGNLLAGLGAEQTSPMGSASFEAVPVEPRDDLDEVNLPDVNNVLSGVQYIKDLYEFYDEQQHVGRPIDYMHHQIDMTAGNRENLVYFLMTVHDELNLQPETLYLAVSIVDRFLSLHNVPFYKLRIVGLSSLFIATKYEEDWVPKVYEFLTVSGGEYSKVDVFYWERVILDALEWYLTVPTVYMFLIRYMKAAKADEELKNMIYCYGKLALTQYSLVLFLPSMVAAATLYAARCTLERYPHWTDTLQRHTSYSESQLVDCAKIIVQAHLATLDY